MFCQDMNWFLQPMMVTTFCISYQVQVKFCLSKYNAMKTYLGSGGIAPCNLNLSTRWRGVLIFMPRLLYSRCPLDRKLGWPKSQSGGSGEEKKFWLCRESKAGGLARNKIFIDQVNSSAATGIRFIWIFLIK